MSEALGKSTVESIQSGLYFGHLGQMREISNQIKKECFKNEEVLIIGTGGFSHLFEKEKIFEQIIPDLVLKGLLIANQMNKI
jgi:type III pantothenate kinase